MALAVPHREKLELFMTARWRTCALAPSGKIFVRSRKRKVVNHGKVGGNTHKEKEKETEASIS